MNGPTNEFREVVFLRLKELSNTVDGVRVVTPELEEQLDVILSEVNSAVSADVEASSILKSRNVSTGNAYQLLAAVDQWASVASYVVAWLYAPQSPSPERMAGWAGTIAETLRKIATALLKALATAAKSLRASSWSIGLGFPLGISVSLTWP